MEPSLKYDTYSSNFLRMTRNIIPIFPILYTLCLNCFINLSLTDSSILICIVNATFLLFYIFSSCSIKVSLLSYFIIFHRSLLCEYATFPFVFEKFIFVISYSIFFWRSYFLVWILLHLIDSSTIYCRRQSF